MKKVVLKFELYDDRIKQKTMKAVAGIAGVEHVSVNMKEKTLKFIGNMDVMKAVGKVKKKVKKLCRIEIESVGPAEEAKKTEEPKKEPKKEEAKKSPRKRRVSSVEENPNAYVIF